MNETIEKISKLLKERVPNKTWQPKVLAKEIYDMVIKDGTLVELPCKVGDTVYGINRNRYGFFVDELFVDSIEVFSGCRFNVNVYIIKRDEEHSVSENAFGVTVFLTLAEAKQKLKELQDENSVIQE